MRAAVLCKGSWCACGSVGIGAGSCARVGAVCYAGVRDGSQQRFTEQGCEAAAACVTSAAAAGIEVPTGSAALVILFHSGYRL